MGKVKEIVTDKAIAIALLFNISLDDATDIAMSYPISVSVDQMIYDIEGIDYQDTPPELGMAGDYEDCDEDTQHTLKNIVGE